MFHISAKARFESFSRPVGAEHRDAFLQGVERLALDPDHGVVARLEMDALAQVVEQIGEPALGTGVGDDPQGSAVGQVPPALMRLDGPIGGEQRRLPAAKIRLFGQFPRRAQAVEHLAVERPLVEETLIEVPELAIGGVVEDETLPSVEHCDRGGQLVQRAHMGVHLALQVATHALEFGDVDRDAGTAPDGWPLHHVENPPRARDHRRHPGRETLAFLAAPRGFLARRAVEEFEPARLGILETARLDSRHESLVGPGEPPVPVAQPDRLADGVEQGAQYLEFVARAKKVLGRAQQAQAVARDLAEAKQRPAAGRAALRVDEALAGRAHGEPEPFAAGPQPVKRALQRLRIGVGQPGVEVEHAALVVAHDREVALERRVVLGAVPGDDELAL
jgi:hypothetical protein